MKVLNDAAAPRLSGAFTAGARTLLLLAVVTLGACSLMRPPEDAAVAVPVERPPPPPPVPTAPANSTARPFEPVTATPPAPKAVELPATPAPALPPASTRHYQLSPATNALVGQAQAAGAKADYLTAMSILERAVRIEPRNPLVWIEMAKIRLAAGEAAQAESVARKAVALSEGDQRTSGEAWKQVALALKAQNRNPEAAAAEARANRPFTDGDPLH